MSEVKSNSFWKPFKIFDAISWWLDRTTNNIHFSASGQWFASTRGSVNTGATYHTSEGSGQWFREDTGLGLDISDRRNWQYFTENSNGRIYMIQLLDERIYQKETRQPNPVKGPVADGSGFSIYPNPVPAGGILSLQHTFFHPAASIRVLDVSGHVLEQILPGSRQQDVRLRAPRNPGLYFIQLRSAGASRTVRLIVL
jgi:hypothetical protein